MTHYFRSQTLRTCGEWLSERQYVYITIIYRLEYLIAPSPMLNNLKNPPERFADVIRTHFRLKARSILKQLDEWLKLDDGKLLNSDGAYSAPGTPKVAGSSSNGFAEDVQELRGLLDKLMAGGDIDQGAGPSGR